jgi:hypothetical protein
MGVGCRQSSGTKLPRNNTTESAIVKLLKMNKSNCKMEMEIGRIFGRKSSYDTGTYLQCGWWGIIFCTPYSQHYQPLIFPVILRSPHAPYCSVAEPGEMGRVCALLKMSRMKPTRRIYIGQKKKDVVDGGGWGWLEPAPASHSIWKYRLV